MSSPSKPLAFGSPRAERASPFARSPSLSPEKSNPFVRRSSVMQTGDRPRSPFARPANRLSVVETSSTSRPSTSDSLAPPISFSRDVSPSPSVEREHSVPPSPSPASSVPESPILVEKTPLSPVAPPSPALQATPIAAPQSPAPQASPLVAPSPAISPIATRQSRPAPQRTVTSSTQATIRPPLFTSNSSSNRPASRDSNASRPNLTTKNSFSAASRASNPRPAYMPPQMATGQYSHIPQPLLHSMRESFEVLDSSNTGSITSASVSEMLQQMGMDNSPRALSAFFPPNTPSTISLGKFLDLLSTTLQDLSMPDELAAAFAAFDVDDSGQIDKAELRDALLNTAPEPGTGAEEKLTEQAIDGILAQYSARRAFGAKGVFGKELGAGGAGVGGNKTRGEVFRYRDFMASVSGSGGNGEGGAEQVVA